MKDLPPYRKYDWMAGISLGLLLIFISIWTKSNYQNEKEELRQNTHLVFANVIRETEDSLLKSMLVRIDFKDTSAKDESIIIFDREINHHTSKISIDSILRTTKQIYGRQANRTLTLKVESDSMPAIQSLADNNVWIDNSRSMEIPGMLSLHIRGVMDQDPNDSNQLAKFMVQNIEEKIKKTLQPNSPIQYKLVKLGKESEEISLPFGVGTYVDLVNGQSFEARIPNYRSLILQKIWPTLVFSFLLFLCIATAFVLILKAMRSQHRLVIIKNDFISNMTHELKTPITTVGVALEALSNFDGLNDPVKAKEYIEISQKELNRLGILVDKVMKMTIFEKGEPDLNIEKIDLLKITREVVSSMRIHVEKFAGTVSLETFGEDFHLQGDRIHLTSVIYNLIDNALKYTNQKPIINIHLLNHLEEVILTIEDNGIGIDSSHLNKIFEKFYRVTTGDRHNVKGYGLGLSYVAGVVKKHFGKIRVESSPGKGSKFIIALPRIYARS